MRQPRHSASSTNDKPPHVYRSNSLPRDVKVDFRNDSSSSAEPKKTVKTVRYDETVKSAEIAQDMPPSLSPAQAEETLLPAKREAPIGCHDEKYSENTTTSTPPYHISHQRQLSNGNTQSQDLRDSIVNARKELLARKPDTIKTVDKSSRHNVIPTFEPPQHSFGSSATSGYYPVVNPRQNRPSQMDSRSFYHSQEGMRPQQSQKEVPFSHYANGNHARLVNQLNNRNHQQYTTSSLPRLPRYGERQQNGGTLQRRAPLPSYEEVQSNRLNSTSTLRQSIPEPRDPPGYQTQGQPSYHTNSAANPSSHMPNKQPFPVSEPNNNPLVQSTNQHAPPNRPPIRRANSSVQPSTLRSNGQHPQHFMSTNQLSTHTTNMSARSSTLERPGRNRNVENNVSYQRHFTDVTHDPVVDLTSVNNTGSCSSSNPDSGYSGNFYDSHTNGCGAPADYNSWYQQNLQSTALKMNENKSANRNFGQQASPNQYTRNGLYKSGPQFAAPKRTIYTNMTSDV